MYPAQQASVGAPERLIKHNEGGRCGAISNLGATSFVDGVITFGNTQFLTNANMNGSQPGIQSPIPGVDPPIPVAIRWQSSYRFSPAVHFLPSTGGLHRTLRSTWIVPALAYSPLVRANLTHELLAAGENPDTHQLDEAFTDDMRFVFEYAVDLDRVGQYITASPDDWHHLIWLEPSLALNNLFHPLVDENGDCWLEIRSEADLKKLQAILKYFEVESRLVDPDAEPQPEQAQEQEEEAVPAAQA